MIPDLSISIVSYKTRDLLERCLASVYANGGGLALEVIVVDNASQDGSAQMVRERFPQARLVANPSNRFFTRANNQALRLSQGRYVLVLNSDTAILEGALQRLVEFMDQHPEVGAVSPRQMDPSGQVVSICSGHTSPLVDLCELTLAGRLLPCRDLLASYRLVGWDRESPREVEVIPDSSMLVRREAVDQVGLYDERFLLYYTENDWCRRLQRVGWKVYYWPEAAILHQGRASVNREAPAGIWGIFRRDLLRYHLKHHGPGAWLALWLALGLSRLALGLRGLVRPSRGS